MPQVPCPVPLASPQGTAHAAGQLASARRAQGKARAPVTVPIPLVAILGVAVYVACRYMGLRVWQAIVYLLAGFHLAATTAAPHISEMLRHRAMARRLSCLTSSRPWPGAGVLPARPEE
ncbi:MAG TPA: hypothetical protein VNF47_20480 [Streptosporangiaceae bacterium]|nr:hypothetical protein [Streptosporangiaceae bacterium]